MRIGFKALLFYILYYRGNYSRPKWHDGVSDNTGNVDNKMWFF